MIINFKTQDVSLAEDLNDLLCQLNKRISSLAKVKLNSERFGSNEKIDEDKYFILVKYKEILILKANGSACLKDYSLDSIMSIIRQYLTSGVIQKFSKTELSEGGIAGSEVNITYKYENNITYNVYNYTGYTTNNNTISQIIEDSWDETAW